MLFNLTYTDVDASPDEPISTGDIFLSCLTSDEILENDTNYWYTYIANGIYTVNISTITLGNPDSYEIIIILN